MIYLHKTENKRGKDNDNTFASSFL